MNVQPPQAEAPPHAGTACHCHRHHHDPGVTVVVPTLSAVCAGALKPARGPAARLYALPLATAVAAGRCRLGPGASSLRTVAMPMRVSASKGARTGPCPAKAAPGLNLAPGRRGGYGTSFVVLVYYPASQNDPQAASGCRGRMPLSSRPATQSYRRAENRAQFSNLGFPSLLTPLWH